MKNNLYFKKLTKSKNVKKYGKKIYVFSNLKLKSNTDIGLKAELKHKTIQADPWLAFAPLNVATETKYLPDVVYNSKVNEEFSTPFDYIEATVLVDEPFVEHAPKVELDEKEVFDVVFDETSAKQDVVSSETVTKKPKVKKKVLKEKKALTVADVQDLYLVDSMEEISTVDETIKDTSTQIKEYKLLKKEHLYFLLVIIILSFSFYSFI